MAAPKGNQYWKSRLKTGRELIFKTPSALLAKGYEYFEWADANAWIKNEAIKSGDSAGTIVGVPTQRPYTVEGFCVYAGISKSAFNDLYAHREGFVVIVTHIREVIEANQLEGAAVGAYNPSIIARKLGLKEQSDVTSNGKDVFSSVKVKIIRSKEDLKNE